jgi:AcrR family transcriptional regulator
MGTESDTEPDTVGRAATPATRKGTHTRERIRVAAVSLFSEQGYHATSIAEIGVRADIQRGALYYHIRSKEELLFDVLRDLVERVLDGVRVIAEEQVGPSEKLRRLIVFQTRTMLDRHQEMVIYSRDGYALTDYRLTRFRQLQGAVEDVWVRVLEEGGKSGELRTVDPAVRKSIILLVNSPHDWFRSGGRLTNVEVGEMLADLVMRGVANPPPDERS